MLPLLIRANTRTPFLTESHLSSSWPWYVAAGIALVAFLPTLYINAWWLCIFMLVFSIWKWPSIRRFSLTLLLFTSGALWGSLIGQATLDKALPERLIKQDVQVHGIVLSIPRRGRHSVRFQFNILELKHHGKLQSYGGPVILSCYAPCPEFRVGQRWQLTLHLKPAHGSLNPGGFNYSKWLFSQSIRATGYVRAPNTAQLLQAADSSSRITQLRADIQQFIASRPLRNDGVLAALAVGLRDNISDHQWQVFRRTGTAHLIAISGLHIGMVAAIAYFLGALIWRHSLLARSQIPAQSIARISAILAATGYAALAGFALPTLRALLMLIAYFVLLGLRRNPGIRFGLGMVLMVVLLFDPLAALSASLWLSFGAVAAIAIATGSQPARETNSALDQATSRAHKIRRVLSNGWHAQWAVFLGLLPISLLFFQQISLVSLAANFVAIPVVAMTVVPIILLALLLWLSNMEQAADMLFKLADSLLSLLWKALESLSDLPLSIWISAAPPTWVLLLSLLAVGLMLKTDLGKIRHFAALGLLPLFLQLPVNWPEGRFEVQILDVGQGLSLVVQTATHRLIYDAGAHYDSGFDNGTAVVIPFLRQQHIRALDVAVISHDNLDHYGGMAAVLEEMPTRVRYSSSGFYAQSRPCRRGQSWNWDGVQFDFLNSLSEHGKADNNDSCVLKISSRYGSILLPGDIERKAEKQLLVSMPAEIRNIDVLISPHHGSKTSSTEEFLKQLNPQLVVVSAGYLNRFNHPSPRVVERYKAFSSAMINTSSSGSIRLRFAEAGIDVQAWRTVFRRYWLESVANVKPHTMQTRHRQTARNTALSLPFSTRG